jgi:penicillin-binding protein 2
MVSRRTFFPFFKRPFRETPLDPHEILADSVSILASADPRGERLERPIGRIGSFFFLAVAALTMLYLARHAAALQIEKGEEFFSKSQENRFLSRPIFPPRGIIYDSRGTVMAENVPSFGLLFEKQQFLKSSSGKGDLGVFLKNLSSILGKPPDFFIELGFPRNFNIADAPERILIAKDIPHEQVIVLAARGDILPGLQLFEGYRRAYLNPLANSHILGFTGKTSPMDIKQNPALLADDVIGKSGVEFFYDDILRGSGGKKIIEVDSEGKESLVRFAEEPREGVRLELTIDADLQRVAYETAAHYAGEARGASVVILDPRSGAVRALVSYPGFDINRFGVSLSRREFSEILDHPSRPLFNRAIGGEFPSGSIIKPIWGAAGLTEKVTDPKRKIYDVGFIEIPNPFRPGESSVFRDWKKHGWINFFDAIANSANVYFYILGGGYQGQEGLGIERMRKYAAAFGLGSRLGIDLPGEKPGIIPDPEWKKENEPNDPLWRIGDTYNVSIGQGGLKVTPLQMAAATAVIANGGILYRPHLLHATIGDEGRRKEAGPPEIIHRGIVSQFALDNVRAAMRQTVLRGTARNLGQIPVGVAAKTGTAQTGYATLPHAWVTAFAPFENPEISMAVMVENGGEGSAIAVPIARDILTWHFGGRPEKKQGTVISSPSEIP